MPYQPTYPSPYLTGSIDAEKNNVFKCLINPRDTITGYKIEILKNSDSSMVCEIRGGIDDNGNQYKTLNNSILNGLFSFSSRYDITSSITELDSVFPLQGSYDNESWLQIQIPADITTSAGTGTGMINGEDYKWRVTLYDSNRKTIVYGGTILREPFFNSTTLDLFEPHIEEKSQIGKLSDIKRGMFFEVYKSYDRVVGGGEILDAYSGKDSVGSDIFTIVLYETTTLSEPGWGNTSHSYDYGIYLNSVESYEYYFKARKTPEIIFNTPIPDVVKSSSLSASVTYSQADNVDISYYQIDLYLGDELINSTGEVYSPYISYEYEGLISGNRYRLVLSVVTDDGEIIEPIEKVFTVEYETFQTIIQPIVTVDDYNACIKVDFSKNTTIPGIESGSKEITFEKCNNDNSLHDGYSGICIPYNTTLYWNQANGYPLEISDESTVIIHWHGHKGFSGMIFEKIDEEHPNRTVSLSYSNGNFYYKNGDSGYEVVTCLYTDVQTAINVESPVSNILYTLNNTDEFEDTDTLADTDLNYDNWYLIVIYPNDLKIYETGKYKETVVSK